MLSLAFIREHEARVREAISQRRAEAPLDRLLELDARRRALLQEVEAMRAERNQRSARIGAVKDAATRQALIEETKGFSTRIGEIEPEIRQIDAELEQQLLLVPNLPDLSVPVGADASDNLEVRAW